MKNLMHEFNTPFNIRPNTNASLIKNIFFVFAFLVTFFFLAVPEISFAQNEYQLLTPGTSIDTVDTRSPEALGTLVNSVYFGAISIAAVLAVLVLIIYGFQYSFSETIFKKTISRSRIQGAIGGLLLLLLAVVGLRTIDPELLNIRDSFANVQVRGFSGLEIVGEESLLDDLEDEADEICDSHINSTFNCVLNRDVSLFIAGNRSPQCAAAIERMCRQREILNNNRGYISELDDYRKNACKGQNGPCTLLDDKDGDLKIEQKSCNRSVDGGCRIKSEFYDKLEKAAEIAGGLVCTECGAPTVAHSHHCHSNATCGDVRTNDVGPQGKLDRFMALRSSGLYPVYEVKSVADQRAFFNRLDAIAANAGPDSEIARNVNLMKSKTIVVEKIGAEHFSVYNTITDANHSRSGLGSDGSNRDWENGRGFISDVF